MLTEKKMKKIAVPECVEMLGKDFVYQRKNLCCDCWGSNDDGLFEYTLLVPKETREKPISPNDRKICIDDSHFFDYFAQVIVDPQTGNVERDYERSKLTDNRAMKTNSENWACLRALN